MITIEEKDMINIVDYLDNRENYNDVKLNLISIIYIHRQLYSNIENYEDILTKKIELASSSPHSRATVIIDDLEALKIGFDISKNKFYSILDPNEKYTTIADVPFGDFNKSKAAKLLLEIIKSEELLDDDVEKLLELMISKYKVRALNLYKKSTELLLKSDIDFKSISKLIESGKIIPEEIGTNLAIAALYSNYKDAGIKSTISTRKELLLNTLRDQSLTDYDIIEINNLIISETETSLTTFGKLEQLFSFINETKVTNKKNDCFKIMIGTSESELSSLLETQFRDLFSDINRITSLYKYGVKLEYIETMIDISLMENYTNMHTIFCIDSYEFIWEINYRNNPIFMLFFRKYNEKYKKTKN